MAVRDRLVHLLTEAAEIEHNLLCSYLYAAFSLKRGTEDGLSPTESEAVARWRTIVLGVAIEEMAHLALVNNLLVALGGAPHFDRPNLPVPPGYHPAGFVIRLAPLTKATLDHYIFLERPADAEVPEGAGKYGARAPIQREMTPGHLSPRRLTTRRSANSTTRSVRPCSRSAPRRGQTCWSFSRSDNSPRPRPGCPACGSCGPSRTQGMVGA